MAKYKEKKRRQTRIDRIERKCDRILSELLILRHQVNRYSDIDSVIDKMHRSARKMRLQAENEREAARRMLHSSHLE